MPVDARNVLSRALNELDLDALPNFDLLIEACDELARLDDPNVTQGALNKVHGDWYEWLIAFSAWNYCSEENLDYFILPLPNISSFDCAQLYQESLSSYIFDLRRKVEEANVSLITSNPDFVIVDRRLLGELQRPFVEIDLNTIHAIDNAYVRCAHQCDLETLKGFLSVKKSLRPDRRLQIAHEGSLMKALHSHIQTREWLINPPNLYYFAGAEKIGDADAKAFETIATHSITNVNVKPTPAIDAHFELNSTADIQAMMLDINRMLS